MLFGIMFGIFLEFELVLELFKLSGRMKKYRSLKIDQ